MPDFPVAIITGASRGIGRVVATGLALDGYLTVLIGRSRHILDDVAKDIWEQTGQNEALSPWVLPMDMSHVEAIDRTLGPVLMKLGRVDVLVNNAGQWAGGSTDLPHREFNDLMRINISAQVAVTQSVVPLMKKQGQGHIFNVASRAGKIGFADSGAYCASKFALVGFSESLYRELATEGIKVTALCPGWVHTDMAVEAGTPLAPEDMIQPEDLLQTVRWLLSLSAHACVREVVLECSQNIV